jgi:Holliday junction resolvase RusA-like endonuclease
LKAVLDALNKIAYTDDKQVERLKVYRHHSEPAGICVAVEATNRSELSLENGIFRSRHY